MDEIQTEMTSHKHGNIEAACGMAKVWIICLHLYYGVLAWSLDILIGKVLSLLEACFDLISVSSLAMKIQIMCGKITENLGFKSPLL